MENSNGKVICHYHYEDENIWGGLFETNKVTS